ncbi:MAG: 2-C-methyl-D-erythritol 4-phosphate cytidylyltransferase [Leptospirales bacterium]|nr:2-C-methyl-D-erythritol 4-phosphate cytidylyltransferase [Leptospirales bacterium]
MERKIHTILLSGGTGKRMGLETPKQFLQLAGKPVILHSAETLKQLAETQGNLGQFVVIAPTEFITDTERALSSIKDNFRGELRITSGGETRQESTLKGLRALDGVAVDNDLVLIHDAARPLISKSEVTRLCEELESNSDFEIASLVGPVAETIVSVNSNNQKALNQPVPRDALRAVKTPQALRWAAVKRLRSVHGEFTDLLSWAHAAGLAGLLVTCDPGNIKLTSPADLVLLESLIAAGK